MLRIFIVHRWDGSPNSDWLPTVARELATRAGAQIHALTMPNPSAPTIETWVEYLATEVGTPDAHTFFIGHSIGCQTILRYLERINTPVGGAIFIAGWFSLTNLEDDAAEKIASPWITTPINFEKIRAVLPRATAILSTNDPFVPFEKARAAFESQLNARVITLENAGHITEDDGFTELPIAVSEFEKMFTATQR